MSRTIEIDAIARRNLTLCPRCGYALNGLPEAHNCPECGLRYDSMSLVWREPAYSAFYTRKIHAVFAIALLSVVFISKAFILGQWPTRYMVGLIIGVGAVSFTAIQLLQRGGEGLLVTLPDGLTVCDAPGRRCRIVAWSSIRALEVRTVGARVFPLLVCDDRVLSLSRFVRDAASTEVLGEVIRRRVGKHSRRVFLSVDFCSDRNNRKEGLELTANAGKDGG